MTGTTFDAGFRRTFAALLAWRRDVRRFRTAPVDEALLDHLLDLACLAPSVGNSRPWRFVRVDDPGRRAACAPTSPAATPPPWRPKGFRLAARAHGVGVGWVSILDPARVGALLEVPESWRLVAYLCVGWPEEEHVDPELERAGWQPRTATCREVWRR